MTSDYEDERPVHQPPAYDAPIPGIHFYAGCDPDGPRVTAEGVCEGCGEHACPVCGKGGEMISCPACGEGRVHYGLSCCTCRLTWKQLEERMVNA